MRHFHRSKTDVGIPNIVAHYTSGIYIGQTIQTRTTRRQLDRLEQSLNRVRNLAPGRRRIEVLENLALGFRSRAEDSRPSLAEGWNEEALFLERLAWDLTQLRDHVRGGARQKGPRP